MCTKEREGKHLGHAYVNCNQSGVSETHRDRLERDAVSMGKVLLSPQSHLQTKITESVRLLTEAKVN